MRTEKGALRIIPGSGHLSNDDMVRELLDEDRPS